MNEKAVFENFRSLRNDMIRKGWAIDAFLFIFKKIEYVTIIKLYQENEYKPDYSLLKVEFIRMDNTKEFHTHANTSKLFLDNRLKEFREFFNIEYSINLGDIIKQFNNHFSTFIPEIVLNKPIEIKNQMVKSLSNSDNENPNKIYCFSVKRNADNGKRSIYNDNKTQLLRPNLYLRFKDDLSISFCYSEDENRSTPDETIIFNFSKNK